MIKISDEPKENDNLNIKSTNRKTTVTERFLFEYKSLVLKSKKDQLVILEYSQIQGLKWLEYDMVK